MSGTARRHDRAPTPLRVVASVAGLLTGTWLLAAGEGLAPAWWVQSPRSFDPVASRPLPAAV